MTTPTSPPISTVDSVTYSSPLSIKTTPASSIFFGGVTDGIDSIIGNVLNTGPPSPPTSSSDHPAISSSSTWIGYTTMLTSSPTAISTSFNDELIHIIKPDAINYCQDVRFEWTRGAGPQYIYEVHGPNSFDHWLDTGNDQNFTIWNWLVRPGEQLVVTVKDRSGGIDTKLYTVGGDANVPCPSANPNTAVGGTELPSQSPVGIANSCLDGLCQPKRLSTGAIAGLSVGALAIVCAISMAIWLMWRKKYGKPRLVIPLTQEDKEGDRASINTARSSQSIWSTFSGRNDHPNVSLEDGVRVDISSSQARDDTSSPVTTLPSTTPLLMPSRTRGRWNGRPATEKGRRVAQQPPTSPIDEQSSLGSLREESVYSESINPPSTQERVQSPFSDVHGAVIAAWNDMKLGSSGNLSSSEADARQLSPSELEALADMVAARLNQRMDRPSAPYSRDSHAPSEELPRYS